MNSKIVGQNIGSHEDPNSICFGTRFAFLSEYIFHWLPDIVHAKSIVKFRCHQLAPTLASKADHADIIAPFFKCFLHNILEINTLIRPNLSRKEEQHISLTFLGGKFKIYFGLTPIGKLKLFLLVILPLD